MHSQTRKCHEFLMWLSRFEHSADVAPQGASYAEIFASLNSEERVIFTRFVAEHGEAWVVSSWAFLRIQCLYVRSL